VVCAALDKQKEQYVAIKKCKKIFHSRTMAKRALREIRILRLLDHENVISLKCVLHSMTDSTFTEMYIIFEIMQTDLAMIIRSSQVLCDTHVQCFVHQMLLGLQYLQGHQIVHRDIKPRNLLVNSNCQLKIADFGLARVYSPDNENKIVAMTEYVTTRWYRAPEVIVGWHRYDYAVDMWAVGAIIAELMGRVPIFAGGDSAKQLDLIIRTLGSPDEAFIALCRKPTHRKFLRKHVNVGQLASLEEKYPHANPRAIALMSKLLVIDPAKRPTASEALASPWMEPLNDGSSTVVLPYTDEDIRREFEYEDKDMTSDELRKEMLSEMCYYDLKDKDYCHRSREERLSDDAEHVVSPEEKTDWSSPVNTSKSSKKGCPGPAPAQPPAPSPRRSQTTGSLVRAGGDRRTAVAKPLVKPIKVMPIRASITKPEDGPAKCFIL
jgi:serine/threonine protein kinase